METVYHALLMVVNLFLFQVEREESQQQQVLFIEALAHV
jgi:hypothetical protein